MLSNQQSIVRLPDNSITRLSAAHICIALSSATCSTTLNDGTMTSTMPAGPSLTGIAPVRRLSAASGDAASGATKQLATRRERPAIASSTLVTAAASAYGPGGQS